MKNVVLIGVLAAVVTGMAIGSQSTLGSRIGAMIGPLRTGLLMNMMGGSIALVLFGITLLLPRLENGTVPQRALVMLAVAGALGVLIIMGISFALQRIGVTAGLAAVILGQMAISIVVDTTGWGGVEPIPLTGERLAGLAVMGAAVYLLVPRA